MPHPLDPLSAAEIEAAVLHFRAGHSDQQAFFCSIERLEPAKHLLQKGDQCPRSVRLMVLTPNLMVALKQK
jgi:Cu2+-containing amine oxidase